MKKFLLVLLMVTLCCGLLKGQSQTQSKQLSIQVVAVGSGHVVNLSWTAPPVSACGNVVGYKVYKGTSVTNLVFLASTATIIYVDQAVTSGQTYSYYVTSVADSSSTCSPLESVASNIASVSVP